MLKKKKETFQKGENIIGWEARDGDNVFGLIIDHELVIKFFLKLEEIPVPT